jgi:hypothetical protein
VSEPVFKSPAQGSDGNLEAERGSDSTAGSGGDSTGDSDPSLDVSATKRTAANTTTATAATGFTASSKLGLQTKRKSSPLLPYPIHLVNSANAARTASEPIPRKGLAVKSSNSGSNEHEGEEGGAHLNGSHNNNTGSGNRLQRESSQQHIAAHDIVNEFVILAQSGIFYEKQKGDLYLTSRALIFCLTDTWEPILRLEIAEIQAVASFNYVPFIAPGNDFVLITIMFILPFFF